MENYGATIKTDPHRQRNDAKGSLYGDYFAGQLFEI